MCSVQVTRKPICDSFAPLACLYRGVSSEVLLETKTPLGMDRGGMGKGGEERVDRVVDLENVCTQ